MNIKKLVRTELTNMTSYAPIEPTDVLSRRAELPVDKVVKLDGNENPYGCSPKVYQALAAYPYYHNYPDPEQRELRKALAEYTGLGSQHIVCGMGSDELIDLILRLFLEPGEEVMNCPPTFGMYPFSTDVCGGRVVDVAPEGGILPSYLPGMKKTLTKKTKVIFVASPNNPTGNIASKKEIMELVDSGRIVVVDEAYFEFSDATVADSVLSYPNMVVLRTFSKWAGLAGLRIGYGFFPADVAGYLMKIKPPYNVNAAAQAAVMASLADTGYLRANVARIVAERDRLFGKLKELGWLKPYPSQANFILCRLPGGKAEEVWQQLRKRGIFVRYFDAPRLKDCLRISVGRPDDTDALVKALKEVEHG